VQSPISSLWWAVERVVFPVLSMMMQHELSDKVDHIFRWEIRHIIVRRVSNYTKDFKLEHPTIPCWNILTVSLFPSLEILLFRNNKFPSFSKFEALLFASIEPTTIIHLTQNWQHGFISNLVLQYLIMNIS